MCFNKRLKEQVKSLQEAINELQKTIVTQELTKLREESKNYAEERSNLKNIHIKLKNIKYIDDGTDLPHIEISYDIPGIKLFFNENKEVIRNEMFRSINILNLLSMKDMNKIAKTIEDAKTKL